MQKPPLHPVTPQWVSGELQAGCPVCGSSGVKRRVATARSPFSGEPDLDYVRCAECEACFVPGFKVPPYAAPSPLMTRFYVEQGAGIDTMIEPLFSLPHARIRDYLEIGCGYGFSVDFAQRTLGWNARGVDPSANAAEGKRALGVEIDPQPWSGGGGEPVDLLYSSEMIEHLPDPPRFLAAAARQLAGGGVLLLTTPNARLLSPQSSSFTNYAILSAGYHCVLFSPATMERALTAAGFKSVRVWQGELSLLAMASQQALPPAQPSTAYRAAYRGYLKERLATFASATPLATGFAYRLFKDLVNIGDYKEAERVRARVLVEVGRRFDLDLADPGATDGLDFGALTGDGASSLVPFNVTGCYYFQGMLELNYHGDWRRAEALFAAAGRAAARIRAVLQSAGADDGETEDLERQAARHVAIAHARGG